MLLLLKRRYGLIV